ncbi:MAG: redox-sensing transcriptional repressor Rex [Candidatus Omnitrophica bacterium]|nr:redox-sensing transcriptional repressor Rex [Candidatus Omnitrophota bacterium]
MEKLPHNTIARVFLYIRALEDLARKKHSNISSRQLAELTDSSDVQVRKDISNFGKIGTPGIGYSTIELKDRLENFVLKDRVVRAVLFGVGNLGTAVLKYPAFYKDRLKIVAAFDSSEHKIGKVINNIEVFPVQRAAEVIESTAADIAIIAVPQEAAQSVADIVVASGLIGIVNFAPATIGVPEGIFVKNIDFTIEFLSLYCDAYMAENMKNKNSGKLAGGKNGKNSNGR